jgi:hypothetical protein
MPINPAYRQDREMAELMPGVRLPEWASAFGRDIAGKHRSAFRALERLRVESERCRQRPVERDQPRIADRGWGRFRIEEARQIRVGVLETPA